MPDMLECLLLDINGTVYDGPAAALILKTKEGEKIGIFPGHENLMTILAQCLRNVTVRRGDNDETTHDFAGGGVALVEKVIRDQTGRTRVTVLGFDALQ